jgi:CubicO group peptidase (beta-lactamase class C family)
MPDVTDYRWNYPEYDEQSLERWIRGLTDSALIAAPGERWQYSNIAFELLADLGAKASGESFEIYVQKRILTPLAMRKSTLLMTDIDSSLMAWGHRRASPGLFACRSCCREAKLASR